MCIQNNLKNIWSPWKPLRRAKLEICRNHICANKVYITSYVVASQKLFVFISYQMINSHSSLRGNLITKNTMKYIYYHCYYGNRDDKSMKMYYFRHKMSN